MSKITDEILMAYVDDELTSTERRQVEAAMKSDPTIESRIAVFSETEGLLSGVYDEPMHRPIPDKLIDTIMSGTEGTDHATPSTGVQPDGNWIARSLEKWLPLGGVGYTALAAYSVILVATGFLGWQLGALNINKTQGDNMLVKYEHGQLLALGRLNTALDTVSSGQKLVWSYDTNADRWIKPAFTFRTPTHSYCRQYQIAMATDEGFSGVACRNGAGAWQIHAHLVARPAQTTGDKIVPAAGPGSDLIDKVVDQLIEGDVLGSKEEENIIKNRWKGAR